MPTNATILDSQGTGTITNDDGAPTLSINDVSVAEGNTGTATLGFTVTLSAASGQTVTVGYATANGTATIVDGDYLAASGTLTFAPGVTTQPVNVTVNGDVKDEANETLLVNLSVPTNATILDSQGIGTITNDDGAPTLSINDVSVAEGNAGTATLGFTVSLSAASGQTVTVGYATANGTATIADGDYLAASGTLTFAPGVTTQPVSVTVNGDVKAEPNETLLVNLSVPTNATILDSQGTGTITNDDGAPTLSINDVSVAEGNTGTATLGFTVTLSAASGQTVTVGYATANGTATIADGDYLAASGTLTFAPGVTTQPVSVTVNGDVKAEPNETLLVNLSVPTNATILDSQGTGTITNDDGAPTLSIDDVSVAEGNTGTATLGFTVTLSAASGQTVTVGYATANGTATIADGDYLAASGTLTFAPGVTTQPVSVTVNGDVKAEPNETLLVNLSVPTNATILDSQGTGTITNDDGAPTLSIDDVVGRRGQHGDDDARLHRHALGGERADRHGRLRDRQRDRHDRGRRLPRGLRDAHVCSGCDDPARECDRERGREGTSRTRPSSSTSACRRTPRSWTARAPARSRTTMALPRSRSTTCRSPRATRERRRSASPSRSRRRAGRPSRSATRPPTGPPRSRTATTSRPPGRSRLPPVSRPSP